MDATESGGVFGVVELDEIEICFVVVEGTFIQESIVEVVLWRGCYAYCGVVIVVWLLWCGFCSVVVVVWLLWCGWCDIAGLV